MKQFARDIDDRMPEPWSPVVCTVKPPLPSGVRMPRWNSVRPGIFRIGADSGTLKVGSGGYTVHTTGDQGSGILSSMSRANCFIVLDTDTGNVAAGELVAVQLLEGLL